MTSKGLIAILASMAVALAIALPAAFGASKATVVNVTAGKPSELKFTLSKKTAAKGVVTFKVTNRGALEHDFKIAGKVTKKLKPGTTATLKVTFKRRQVPVPVHGPGPRRRGNEGRLRRQVIARRRVRRPRRRTRAGQRTRDAIQPAVCARSPPGSTRSGGSSR